MTRCGFARRLPQSLSTLGLTACCEEYYVTWVGGGEPRAQRRRRPAGEAVRMAPARAPPRQDDPGIERLRSLSYRDQPVCSRGPAELRDPPAVGVGAPRDVGGGVGTFQAWPSVRTTPDCSRSSASPPPNGTWSPSIRDTTTSTSSTASTPSCPSRWVRRGPGRIPGAMGCTTGGAGVHGDRRLPARRRGFELEPL